MDAAALNNLRYTDLSAVAVLVPGSTDRPSASALATAAPGALFRILGEAAADRPIVTNAFAVKTKETGLREILARRNRRWCKLQHVLRTWTCDSLLEVYIEKSPPEKHAATFRGNCN